jgi:hypothetical protein
MLFFAAFFGIVGYLVYRVIKFGGLRAALYGARIAETIGTVSGASPRMTRLNLTVQVLQAEANRRVGLAFVAKSFLSYQVMPISLEVSATEDLVRYLQEAVRKAGGG